MRSICLAALLVALARPVSALPMTWDFTGTVTGVTGLLASYVSDGSQVNLEVTGDPSAPALRPSYCANPLASEWFLTGGRFSVGSLTYVLNTVGFLERENESGFCGAVGAPLDIMSFDWTLQGPVIPGLSDLLQVYAALDPTSLDAPTLGDQLADASLAYGSAAGRLGGLTFSDPPIPTPEPATCLLLGLGLVLLGWRR